ncbi:MAG: tRNA pseudouridine(38-40) synthase TruA, partial [Betaproteobacteria bacterium]|nr:tRNA pseudouridine(38-40) synthase TruA [Betaproteobacteria bacterium]
RNSLQDELEAAIADIALEPVRVVCAGRTDTGVHALSQLVHFDTQALRPLSAWVKGVNRVLVQRHEQRDGQGLGRMMVRDAQTTAEDFHARFSALARRYIYVIYNANDWHPHWVNRSGFYYRELDVDAMQKAADLLIGEHDFSAFRAAGCQAASPIRTLQSFSLKAHKPFILAHVQADAFLHHMIRNMLGALLAIGSGDEPPERMPEWLHAADRRLLPPTFSPTGLYFAGAIYPEGALGFSSLSGAEEILPGLCMSSSLSV